MTASEARALANALITQRRYGHFIGGKWRETHDAESIQLSDPARRQSLAFIAAGGPKDAAQAVDAASQALAGWSVSTPAQRQTILLAISQRLRARRAELAVLGSLNNGKPLYEAGLEVDAAAAQFEFFAGAAFHIKGETKDYPTSMLLTHREPIGVVAQIIPWNAPLTMAAMKLAPALAAGCTIVLKPAETVCLVVLEFVDTIADLLPPGVLNVVTGYGHALGEALVTNPKVRKVAFTGSPGTARKIIQYASVNIIPQTMELGGKSANTVCEDADLEAAARSVVMTTTFNKGEVCLAGSRVFVHAKIYDEFVDRLKVMMAAVRQGDPLDSTTQLGAQASSQHFDRIRQYIAIGKAEGASAILGGDIARIDGFEDGLFIQPTLFADVRNDMRIAQEEIFGPVTGLIRWRDEGELLRDVNDSVYGLAGGLWTRDLERAHRLARSIETGIVWINGYYNQVQGLPIGGYKQSGYGRENTLATLDHYTITKSVVINLKEGGITR